MSVAVLIPPFVVTIFSLFFKPFTRLFIRIKLYRAIVPYLSPSSPPPCSSLRYQYTLYFILYTSSNNHNHGRGLLTHPLTLFSAKTTSIVLEQSSLRESNSPSTLGAGRPGFSVDKNMPRPATKHAHTHK